MMMGAAFLRFMCRLQVSWWYPFYFKPHGFIIGFMKWETNFFTIWRSTNEGISDICLHDYGVHITSILIYFFLVTTFPLPWQQKQSHLDMLQVQLIMDYISSYFLAMVSTVNMPVSWVYVMYVCVCACIYTLVMNNIYSLLGLDTFCHWFVSWVIQFVFSKYLELKTNLFSCSRNKQQHFITASQMYWLVKDL